MALVREVRGLGAAWIRAHLSVLRRKTVRFELEFADSFTQMVLREKIVAKPEPIDRLHNRKQLHLNPAGFKRATLILQIERVRESAIMGL